MILTIGIIIVLVASFSLGRKRGLIAMLLRLVSFIVSTLVASKVAAWIGTKLVDIFPTVHTTTQTTGSAITSSNGNLFFYNGVAFFITFLVVMRLIHWLIFRINLVAKIPVIHQLNALAGGLINLLLAYVVIFFLLTIFQVWPDTTWQTQLTSSGLAQWIINQTPGLSDQVVYWFSNR